MSRSSKPAGYIRNRIREDARVLPLLVMDIMIAALCVILVFEVGLTVVRGAEAANDFRGFSEEDFFYQMSRGRYDTMVNMYHTNKEFGRGGEKYEACYAVAEYFEAASYCRMYEEAGDTQRADMWKGRRKDAEERLGDLSVMTEDIQEILAIEK